MGSRLLDASAFLLRYWLVVDPVASQALRGVMAL